MIAPAIALPMPPAHLEHLAKQHQAEVQQRTNRARWIARERLSAAEAVYIPFDYDPDPPQ